MSDTQQTPSSQPDDRVKRFEPARAVCAPRACDRRAGCWVVTGGNMTGGGSGHCRACKEYPIFAGNEAKHAAALRRCMAAQRVAP